MNLLKSFKPIQLESSEIIPIEYFRTYQYQLIDYFFNLCIDQVSKNNNNYIKLDSIKQEDQSTYSGVNQSEFILYTVNVIIDDEKSTFFKVIVPKLVNNNNFIINGTLYTPITYIIDYPIIIKENSISLSSLFSPITIFFKKHFVKFGGKNLNLDYFVHLYLNDHDDNETDLIYSFLDFDKNTKLNEILKYFGNQFKIKHDIDVIKEYVDTLFFDEYTKYLYNNCYFNEDDEINFSEILKKSFVKYINDEKFSFIDLGNKRLVFIELLLAPLLQRIANISHQTKSGHRPNELNMDMYSIVRNFNKSKGENLNVKKSGGLGFHGLSGKTVYDMVNLFSGLLTYKSSMIKPGIENPPKEISNIHPTHFERLCPITIASIEPGKMVSIVPGTKLDVFGRFV